MLNQEIYPPDLNPSFIGNYKEAMNSNVVSEKASQILPHLSRQFPFRVLSIGAGTGGLEHEVTKYLPFYPVFALDYSLPMIETIETQLQTNPKYAFDNIHCLAANAATIPFGDNSVSSIIASSVIHEIASFCDGFRFGPSTNAFFTEAFRVLAPKGRLVIRDFMQLPRPNEPISLQIGKMYPGDFMDPLEFVYRFVDEFKGSDLSYVKKQLSRLNKDKIISLRRDDATEFSTHLSWSLRFDDEVKEKHSYASITPYTNHIVTTVENNSLFKVNIVRKEIVVQPGYAEHINGRFTFTLPNGTKLPAPPIYTGIAVLEKQSTE